MGPEKGGPAGWTVLARDPDGPASLRFKMFLSSRTEGAGRGPEHLGGTYPHPSAFLRLTYMVALWPAVHDGPPGAGPGGGAERGWLRALHGLA